MQTHKLAVIGRDVSKSASPQIHSFIAKHSGRNIRYEKISVPPEEFDTTIAKLLNEYEGLNVTIPYKLTIIPYLDGLQDDAKIFGAVNTVSTRNRTGYNTDGLGFMLMLEVEGVEVKGKDYLIIGAGGAGRSVAKKLADGGANVFIYSRKFQSAKAVADEFDGVRALEKAENKPYYAAVNASGVGMHATEGLSPVGAELLKNCEVAVDLIYEPPVSAFLKIANSLGKKIVNGEQMLFYQAYYSQCIYFDEAADALTAKKLFLKYKEQL